MFLSYFVFSHAPPYTIFRVRIGTEPRIVSSVHTKSMPVGNKVTTLNQNHWNVEGGRDTRSVVV